MKVTLLFLLMLLPVLAHAQIIAEQKSESILDADEFLGYDNLGAVYFIKANALYKTFDSRTVQYKNLPLGKIGRVDLQNPLSVMLFYPDFNTVVLLDNQLNETRKIDFSAFSEPLMVTACGVASQNRLWIYNSITQQIGLFDYLKNAHLPITQQLNGKFLFYQTDFNQFYWVDDKRQGFVTDIFGKIRLMGAMPEFDKGRFTADNKFIFLENNTLQSMNLTTGESRKIETGKKTLSSFWYSPQNLSIFTDRSITTYKIQLP